MGLKLGVVVDEGGSVRNHRSLLKVILNPWLRMAGWQLGTLWAGGLRGYRLVRCPRKIDFRGSWCYDLPPGWHIQPMRRLA